MARIDRIKLGREIRLKLENERTIPLRTKRLAEEVRDHWANVEAPRPGPDHPYSEGGAGSYSESIKVSRERKRFGMPRYEVGTDHPNANFIEYGTGPDKPGSKSPFGPDTPTPEFAPAANTAFHFGGTVD